jgi:hypothetical protein
MAVETRKTRKTTAAFEQQIETNASIVPSAVFAVSV